MNSKSKKVYCFSLPKRKKPYRKSIHIYKKVLDKTLPERTSPISCTLSPAWQITSPFVYVFFLPFKQDIKCSILSSCIPLKRAEFDREEVVTKDIKLSTNML